VTHVTDQPTETPRARRLPLRAAPNDGVTDWPNTPSPDPAAEKVRQLAARLATVMAERGLSARAVAKLAGIGVGTIQVIKHGNRWPDSRAVARLEVALNTALWPAHNNTNQ
jgi:ribosome-binding protein aMBF1 (putative translation factor)